MWDNLEAWTTIGWVSVVVIVIILGLRAVTQSTLKDTLHKVDEEPSGDDDPMSAKERE